MHTIGELGAAAAAAISSILFSSCTLIVVDARVNHLGEGLELEHDQLSQIGLHSGFGCANAEATMEPDLDGRHARDLQSISQHGAEMKRDVFSALAHLGLDPAVPFW